MSKFTSVSIFLLAILSTLALTFPIQPRDINTFKEDLGVLSRGISGLSIAVNSIGHTITPRQALVIYRQGEQVKREIDTCNGDATGIHSVSNADAKDVLHIVKGFAPIIVETLETLGKKKNIIEQYPLTTPLIWNQIVASHDSSTELGDALVALAPPDSKGEATSLKDQIDAAFNKVIEIYST